MSSARFRRIAVLLLLLITAVSASRAEGRNTSAQRPDGITKQEVLKADAAFNRAILAGDADALKDLLADRLSWVARGYRLDKAQVLADIKSENLHFQSLHHQDLRIEIFGNTAVLTGYSTSILKYRGKLYATPRLFTTVYMKLGGRVQAVAHQVSSVPKRRRTAFSHEAR